MRDTLRQTIATDIPEPCELAPFEFDHDITRRDSWMFAPLIAAAVTLPIIATVLLGASAWHLATDARRRSIRASRPRSQPVGRAARCR